jgi:hypothetical protein
MLSSLALCCDTGIDPEKVIQSAIENYIGALADAGITLRVRRNFETYAAIRRSYGDLHLNQAFDPHHIRFGDRDFWLLAENRCGETIATHCLRRFIVDDFYDLIRSQSLWFGIRPHLLDARFVVACEIPPFGGEVAHGGGLWVRQDYRGSARLSFILPRLARAIALRMAPFDHDSAMIRNDPRDPPRLADRKAAFMGVRAYGFARVHRFVDGWFPPEGRQAVMHLCHATRAEALASLVPPPSDILADRLQRTEFRQRPLVDQDEQLVDTPAVRSQGQQ